VIRRHTLPDADNRRLAHLCGPLDENLRRIEEALGVSLARRDASFRIQGPAPAVDRAAALIDALYDKAQAPIGAQRLSLMLVDAGAPGAPRRAAEAALGQGKPGIDREAGRGRAEEGVSPPEGIRRQGSHEGGGDALVEQAPEASHSQCRHHGWGRSGQLSCLRGPR
jgi:hypothetical protein